MHKGILVIDPLAPAVLAMGGEEPSGGYQPNQLAVDRDGYIHDYWGVQSGSPVVQVFEYVPPATLNLLYSYSLPAGNTNYGMGIAVSRSGNVVCATSEGISGGYTGAITFFH